MKFMSTLAIICILSSCSPAIKGDGNPLDAFPADTFNKTLQPESRWNLKFVFGSEKQDFSFSIPKKVYLTSINTAKNTQRAVSEILTSSGFQGITTEDEGEGFFEILIFSDPKADLKPRLVYGKYLQHYWETSKEVLYECYFDYKNNPNNGVYIGNSHFGKYQSRYGKELQKSGCMINRV